MSWLSFLFFWGFKHNIISYCHIVLLKSACLGNWTWVIEFRLVSKRIKYNFKWIKNRFEGRNILGHKIIVHLRYIIFRIFGWLTFFDLFFFLLGNCLLRGIEPLHANGYKWNQVPLGYKAQWWLTFFKLTVCWTSTLIIQYLFLKLQEDVDFDCVF